MSQGFESQHRGFHRRPSESFQASEANCVIKYSSWPAAGTTITNEGTTGTAYNGVEAANRYTLQTTGATSFSESATGDYVKIGKGPVVNNLGAHTIEMLISYTNTGTFYVFYKDTTAPYYLRFSSNGLTVFRYGDATHYQSWSTAANVVPPGVLFLQIAWDCATGTANPPLLKINNVAKTLVHTKDDTLASFADDSAYDLYLLNSGYAGQARTNDTIYLFRLHSRVFTSAELTQNYNADKWRGGLI